MARKIKVDFTNVEAYTRCEEGEHIASLKEIEESTSQNGNDMLVAKFEVVAGASKGAIVYNNFTLTEKALWVLQSYLSAVGVKSDKKVLLDIDNLIGKRCIISVIHEEYNGSPKAKIDGFKSLAKKQAEPDDDEYEEEEEEVTPPPKKKKPAPAPVVEEEDEEEDEEPAPAPKKKAATPPPAPAKPAKKKPAPAVEEDDDDWEDS